MIVDLHAPLLLRWRQPMRPWRDHRLFLAVGPEELVRAGAEALTLFQPLEAGELLLQGQVLRWRREGQALEWCRLCLLLPGPAPQKVLQTWPTAVALAEEVLAQHAEELFALAVGTLRGETG